MSSDVGWHVRDKLRPMPKHGSIWLYVHGNQKWTFQWKKTKVCRKKKSFRVDFRLLAWFLLLLLLLLLLFLFCFVFMSPSGETAPEGWVKVFYWTGLNTLWPHSVCPCDSTVLFCPHISMPQSYPTALSYYNVTNLYATQCQIRLTVGWLLKRSSALLVFER